MLKFMKLIKIHKITYMAKYLLRLHAMSLPVFGGRHAVYFFEGADEMLHVAIAYLKTDIHNR